MRVCNHEVMVQDLNPLSARVYFTGGIYVADSRCCPNPKFFAPYFTGECVKSVLTPEVTAAGISWYSEVIQVLRPNFDALFQFPSAYQPPHNVVTHQKWRSWCTGLLGWQLSAERAAKAGKDWSKWGPQQVYLLDRPQQLGNRISKAPNQTQLPHGFGCSFADLQAMRDLSDRGRP